jgi:hypothetical protein
MGARSAYMIKEWALFRFYGDFGHHPYRDGRPSVHPVPECVLESLCSFVSVCHLADSGVTAE